MRASGDPRKDADANRRATNSWLRYSHLGLQFALTMVLSVLAGTWADRRFGWDPWGTIAGSLFGISAAIYGIVADLGYLRRGPPRP